MVGTGERVREIVMLQKHEDLQPQSPPKAQDDITCFSPSAGRNGDKRILGALLLSVAGTGSVTVYLSEQGEEQ